MKEIFDDMLHDSSHTCYISFDYSLYQEETSRA